jgi:hypothetical protein
VEAPVPGRPAHRIAGASYPFCDVHADSSSRAIIPRVADASRMIVLGFDQDDAKLF